MCGIIGFKGKLNASDIVIEGLKKLEYRGYDSWGIAIKRDSIFLKKEVGKVTDFDGNLPESNLAIAHTRWATHGGVTQENAHPHFSCDKKVFVVHNGIVDNFQELKEKLKGHVFTSETDTEVIAHLIEENLYKGYEEAIFEAVKQIEGRYAIAVMFSDCDKLIVARRGSPMIVGVSNDGFFVASDIPAFLKYTNKVMYVDDNEVVVINDDIKFLNLDTHKEIKKRLIEIDWTPEEAEKNGFAHFMLKEIMEQKETIAKAVNQDETKILDIANKIQNAFGTYFVGCGTAGKVCHTAEYFFSRIAGIHVNFAFASEFTNYHKFLKKGGLMVTVSQSGETADVLEAIDIAKKKEVEIISLLNVFGSSMMRYSDVSLMINAGPEKAVASTKATTAQLSLLMLIAYACSNRLQEGKQLLIDTASKVNDMLNPRYEKHIKKLAEKIHAVKDIYIIGRGLNYPISLEAAIKIQEVSYIHAEGFAGGELKHGPIALIEKGTPCIVFVANDENKKDTLGNAMEVKSRGGYIIGVSPENNDMFDYWLKVPDVSDASPIVNIIPVQMLAYYLGVLKGHDPDKPRNLAKSVTVK